LSATSPDAACIPITKPSTSAIRPSRRCSLAETSPDDELLSSDGDHLSPDGRVIEMLSGHICEELLEGYLLTGVTACSTAMKLSSTLLIRCSTSTPNGLESSRKILCRRPISSLNYLLTSHVWRQVHNGFGHQDPGFIDYVCNKQADVIRVFCRRMPTLCSG
jgi:xylulose-5-phosphate/fructose-6-phosphate phosphoketolase